MATIAGSIAEAYYKEIPKWITQETINRLPEEFVIVLTEFSKNLIL
jgi:ADP-ribosylglycohydrolase